MVCIPDGGADAPQSSQAGFKDPLGTCDIFMAPKAGRSGRACGLRQQLHNQPGSAGTHRGGLWQKSDKERFQRQPMEPVVAGAGMMTNIPLAAMTGLLQISSDKVTW